MKRMMYLILGLAVVVAGCGRAYEEEAPLEIPQVDSAQLKQTRITCVMDEPVISGTNLVYCSTFQLAWNELKDGIIKSDIRMQDEPPMVELFNKGLATKKDISDSAYMAMAGFGRDGIVDKINQALKGKFQDQAPKVSEQVGSDEILAYAFLYKNLKFKYVFGKSKYPIDFKAASGNISVKGFGIDVDVEIPDYEEVVKQVSILDYQSDDDFIIRLLTTSVDDEIIMAKINPGKTISEMISTVQSRIKRGTPASFGSRDILSIPKIDFNVSHSYNELLNKNFTNKGWQEYFIRKALQAIRFRLNEIGVILKSESRSIYSKGSSYVARRLVFDKPFLIYLKEKDGQSPYFAMWVDNPELLVKD